MNIRKLAAALVIATGAAVALPALAAPQVYEIDGTHTFPRFSYNHLGLSVQFSRFNNTSGTITLDREARTGAVDIVIDTTSVDTGYATFNEHIQGPDFFDTANHPTATFTSTRVVFEDDMPVAVDGELTIKGVTRPVTLQLTAFNAKPHPMLQKDAIGANATTTIKRSEFNAGKFAPNVGDEVTIDIAVEAVAK
jgi:polyisoprenoid-binding protein YceI